MPSRWPLPGVTVLLTVLAIDWGSLPGQLLGDQPPGSPPVSIDKINATVAAEMKRQKVPGAAVAIVRQGEVVLARGFGESNVEHHVPVTPETIFQSGSVGKQFTAAAIMLLVDDGKITLDDSVAKFWPDVEPWWRPVTIRHLLTHTSGIPNFEPGVTLDMRKDYTDEEFAKLAFGLKPEFAPGTRWSYSNPGFVVLGCIVSKVTGHHYGELLRDRVFRPLGMKTARIISDADIVPHRAAGYTLVDGQLKNQDWTSPSINTTGDGSLYLSLLDMIAWDKGIRNQAILKPDSWKQVFTPVTLKSGKTYPYGFGWFVDQDRGQLRHHHGGAWQGFKTYIARYMGDDLTIILLTNLGNVEPDVFTDAIAGAIDSRLGLPVTPLADKEPGVAQRVREVLAKARANTLTAEDFVHLPVGYFPGLATHHQKVLAPCGELDKLQLVERHQRGDDRWYRWRASCKDKTLEITISLAPGDKLAWFLVKEVTGN